MRTILCAYFDKECCYHTSEKEVEAASALRESCARIFSIPVLVFPFSKYYPERSLHTMTEERQTAKEER